VTSATAKKTRTSDRRSGRPDDRVREKQDERGKGDRANRDSADP